MHALAIITHDHDGFITADSTRIHRLYGFPGMKRTVKMHLLEHHVSEWVDMYNAGFGLMGEQGTEAIQQPFQSVVQDIWLTKYRG